MDLDYTRAIVDAIHRGALDDVETVTDPFFGVEVPTSVPDCPDEVLIPRNTWKSGEAYDQAAAALVQSFRDNFAKYAAQADESVLSGGPIHGK